MCLYLKYLSLMRILAVHPLCILFVLFIISTDCSNILLIWHTAFCILCSKESKHILTQVQFQLRLLRHDESTTWCLRYCAATYSLTRGLQAEISGLNIQNYEHQFCCINPEHILTKSKETEIFCELVLLILLPLLDQNTA